MEYGISIYFSYILRPPLEGRALHSQECTSPRKSLTIGFILENICGIFIKYFITRIFRPSRKVAGAFKLEIRPRVPKSETLTSGLPRAFVRHRQTLP